MSDDQWCKAVLRPEGIACTLKAGHGPYVSTSELRWTTDHCNVARQWSDGRMSRLGVIEWGFNNPVGRKLEES